MDIMKVREKVNYYDTLVRQHYEINSAIDGLRESDSIDIGFMFDKGLKEDSERLANLPFMNSDRGYRFRPGEDVDMLSTEEAIKTILRVNLDLRKKEIETILSKFEEEN